MYIALSFCNKYTLSNVRIVHLTDQNFELPVLIGLNFN